MRNKQRKTDRGRTPPETMRDAVKQVIDGQPAQTVARAFGIDRMTLKRYVKKSRQNPDFDTFAPTFKHTQVFSLADEKRLADYILKASKLHYGLSTKTTRRLAFEYASVNSRKYPKTWNENKSAGKEWLLGFMKRQPQLALRTPEATSMARATSFNRHTVTEFFDNLQDVRSRRHYGPEAIYNVDETGLTTVQKPVKLIAARGAKQVGRMTSAERGNLVTVCCAVNAIGNSVPPFMVFPRVHFKENMITGAPPGTVGVASQSGWMTGPLFLQWMQHFVKHVKCSKDIPIILLLDNHESHVTIEVLDFASTNGITMISFPPHCSHKLQPLDRTVYGPLKRYYNASSDNWMVSNPRPMTIFDIASILRSAYEQAFTQSNIASGFAVSGIEPYNRNIFQDDEFLPATVTDRPFPPDPQDHGSSTESVVVAPTVQGSPSNQSGDLPPQASPSNDVFDLPSTSGGSTLGLHVTPEQLKPFPRAGARKNTGKSRKQKTRILTDTPVKNDIRQARQLAEKGKKSMEVVKGPSSKKCVKRAIQKPTEIQSSSSTAACIKKRRRAKKRNKDDDMSSSDDEPEILGNICDDESEDDDSIRPVRRSANENISSADNCVICGEFGRDRERWYRCTTCGMWAHAACSGVDRADGYQCDHCVADIDKIIRKK